MFLTQWFYVGLASFIALFLLVFYVPVLKPVAIVLFIAFLAVCIAEYSILFFSQRTVTAQRVTANRFSNGDKNKIELIVENGFQFRVHITVIDELPEQLQIRNWNRYIMLKPYQQKSIIWYFKPLQRGEYYFGNIHVFAGTASV